VGSLPLMMLNLLCDDRHLCHIKKNGKKKHTHTQVLWMAIFYKNKRQLITLLWSWTPETQKGQYYTLFGSVRCISTTVNNSPFISMCTLRDLPQQKKNPRASSCLRGSSPILYHMFPCSYENILPQERSTEMKWELFLWGERRFPYFLFILLRLGNTLELMPWGAPPSGEHTCTGTSSTTWFKHKSWVSKFLQMFSKPKLVIMHNLNLDSGGG